MNFDTWLIRSEKFGDIEITPEVINTLASYKQLNDDDLEAGGALIGCILCNDTIRADDLTLPQATDRRTRYSFFRSSTHNKILKDKWEASEGNSYLVGLWHTHPEPSPEYSSEDKHDWDKVLRVGKYEGNYLLSLIVGQKTIRLWITDNQGYKTSFMGEYIFEK